MIRQAIFPVGGLGTRFYPATRALPKEMLPVVDKPLIQYAVEEALASGIEHFVFVTGRGKTAIEDHFDVTAGWQDHVRNRLGDKAAFLTCVLDPGQIAWTRQQEPLGLGHAVWCARHLVRDEPFAVVLADDLIHAPHPCLGQMVAAWTGGCMAAVMSVPRDHTSRYGILDVPPEASGPLFPVRDMVEKPRPDQAPSTLAVIGRYILQPGIMDLLAHQERGTGGEIQLTDALRVFARQGEMSGLMFEGQRLDCGVKEEWILAQLVLGLERPDLGKALRDLLHARFPGGFGEERQGKI